MVILYYETQEEAMNARDLATEAGNTCALAHRRGMFELHIDRDQTPAEYARSCAAFNAIKTKE